MIYAAIARFTDLQRDCDKLAKSVTKPSKMEKIEYIKADLARLQFEFSELMKENHAPR